MSDQITLEAKTRTTPGTTHSRRLRRLDNRIPGVVYGDQKPTVHISVELKVGRKKERVLLRELQRHPATERVLHIDFLRVSDDRELQTSVPIHYLNEETCEGVKLQGGVVSKNLTDVEIACLPKDLPEFISVDLADKVVGTSIHLSDLTLPEGVSIVALQHGEDHDTLVASVHMPRGISTEIEEEEVDDTEGEAQEQEDKDETDSD